MQKIEGYDSFEQIALGGMAAVYKARKVSLDKPVAIKILYPHLAQDAVYIERFKREARTAARVQHDNIVNVLDYGESDGSHYIVMEYCDGVTLEELLEDQPSIPLDICFAIVLNVCYGLEAAHGANLVHRDIKPANIIFVRNGGVKLADFGLAKAVDKLKIVTQQNKVMGTPAYMSPEQTRGDRLDARSDIFSLGVAAYELACNRRPFDGRNYVEVVEDIQTSEPVPVTDINPLIEGPFAHIIARMLEKQLDKRYDHIAEVVIDLEEAMDKAAYRDRRMLGDYIRNPEEYLESFKKRTLEKLYASMPAQNRPKEEVAVHYRRILYLDPSDEQVRARLEELDVAGQSAGGGGRPESPAGETNGAAPADVETCDDPSADYRVYLESIDLRTETPATFALKLSMRIRSPLPRVISVVKNMPTVIAGRLTLEKAKRLAGAVHKLGGVARIEVHPVDESTGAHRPRKVQEEPVPPERPEPISATPEPVKSEIEDPGPAEEPAALDEESPREDCAKTVEQSPIRVREMDAARPRKQPMRATRICPKCKWEEDAEAKFCSVCDFSFNKTEPLDLAALQQAIGSDNPLASDGEEGPPRASLISAFRVLPENIKIGILGGLIVILILIIFGR